MLDFLQGENLLEKSLTPDPGKVDFQIAVAVIRPVLIAPLLHLSG
jgi:hypothetical protein